MWGDDERRLPGVSIVLGLFRAYSGSSLIVRARTLIDYMVPLFALSLVFFRNSD